MCRWMNGKNWSCYIYRVLSKEIRWTRYEKKLHVRFLNLNASFLPFRVGTRVIQ